jgi:hypothetical protein
MKDGPDGSLSFIVYCACAGHDEIHEIIFLPLLYIVELAECGFYLSFSLYGKQRLCFHTFVVGSVSFGRVCDGTRRLARDKKCRSSHCVGGAVGGGANHELIVRGELRQWV